MVTKFTLYIQITTRRQMETLTGHGFRYCSKLPVNGLGGLTEHQPVEVMHNKRQIDINQSIYNIF